MPSFGHPSVDFLVFCFVVMPPVEISGQIAAKLGAPRRVPFNNSNINLDLSGVAGFFGGDVAVTAMSTVYFRQGRKYLGWYNNPGSLEIAQTFGQLARWSVYDGLFPGEDIPPAIAFNLDGRDGPSFIAFKSGAVKLPKTGHLAYVVCEECREWKKEVKKDKVLGENTKGFDAIIVDLDRGKPNSTDAPAQSVKPHEDKGLLKTYIPPLLPILASAGAAAACVFFDDWICFAMIALGMVASGVSCWMIGTGKVVFRRLDASEEVLPCQAGILIDNEDDQIIVLKGSVKQVTAITHGRFELQYKTWRGANDETFHVLGISSCILVVQFLAQLLIVPQGTFFGQIMFLASLGCSWVYNCCISPFTLGSQRRALFQDVLGLQVTDARHARLERQLVPLKSRTEAVVFSLFMLAFACSEHVTEETVLVQIIQEVLPNPGGEWRNWKKELEEEILLYVQERGRPQAPHDSQSQSNIGSAGSLSNLKSSKETGEISSLHLECIK